MSYHTLPKSSFSKSYKEMTFMKFDFFFPLRRELFENFVLKSAYWHLYLHEFKEYVISATKSAIIHLLSRFLQKVISKRFS